MAITTTMPVDLLPFLKSGERARLLPVVADSSKEVRAASILMAVLVAVPKFRSAMLATLGQRVGSRAKIDCFTEVVFSNEQAEMKCRPDGLIVVDGGRGRAWSCLVEAKIGGAVLCEQQVERYANLAKLNGIGSILTIANQFVATPMHTPLQLSRSALKGVELLHWSWMFVLTQAQLVLHEGEIESPTERFILSEFARNLEHPATGTTRFEQMNPEWKDLVLKVQSGAVLSRNDVAVEMSVASWHQEMRSLSLNLSRQLHTLVTISLQRAHKEDADLRLKDDCDIIIRDHKLKATLNVPDAAAPIEIKADLLRRSLVVSMSLEAPKDKHRASARINWLLRQLTKAEAPGIQIRANWPGRAPATQASLQSIRENPEILEADNKTLAPVSFEVLLVADLAGKFAGRRTFIEQIEEVVPLFYRDVGEQLRSYVPPPPRLKTKSEDTAMPEDSGKETPGSEDAAVSAALQNQENEPEDAQENEHLENPVVAEQATTFLYLDSTGEQKGPATEAELKALYASGDLKSESYIYKTGDADWRHYSELFADPNAQPFGSHE